MNRSVSEADDTLISKSNFSEGENFRELVFQDEFIEDLDFWISTNSKTARKIIKLAKEIKKHPFSGTGRPEKLKHEEDNIWSRHINEKDRLVYMITDNQIHLLQARFHYDDH